MNTDAIIVEIPGMKLISLLNQREHWATRDRRARIQRGSTLLMLQQESKNPTRKYPWLLKPLSIIITRVAPRSLDSDNLTASAKHVRDAIADWLGVDDGTPRITWAVDSLKRRPREYSVLILIQKREGT
jgi:hypothetical protein